MRLFRSLLAVLMLAAVFLSACGGGAKEPMPAISVRAALDSLEENQGEKVCVKGFPVAFFYSYTYRGTKVYSIYFSDSAEDFYGEIESVEELRDGWLEVVVREKSPLWQSVREIFEKGSALAEYNVLLKGTKTRLSGFYYDFVELR